MSKRYFYRRILVAGVMLASLGVTACEPAAKTPAQGAEDPKKVGYDFASVNYQELVTLHPNYKDLLAIDEEIARKEQAKVKLGAAAFQELQKKGAGKMKTAVESAKAKLEGERAAIEAEMSALSASLSAQIEGEMKGVQAGLQDELNAEIEKVKKAAGPAKPEVAADVPPPLPNRNEGQVQDYLTNLNMVRERNLAARRLELEKRVGDEVNAKKAEVDGQIAAYEADLAAQYQSERVNLQLTAQNTVDEAAKSAAEVRLSAISGEIDAKKAARRSELEAGYTAVRSEKTAQLQSDLEAYQAELNREVAAKVQAKRIELGQPVAQAQPQRPSAPQGPPPEVKAKIAEMQARMASQLEAKKAELQGQMAGKAAEAKARLEAKQEQVTAELEALQKQIAEELMKEADKLNPKTKALVQKADKEVKDLQEQRKALAEKIAADISREVGEVAKKKEVDMVVGVVPKFEYSSYTDLTEQAKVAVQTEDSK